MRTPGPVRWWAATAPAGDRTVDVRLYRPPAAGPGTLVWAHGGSWRSGTLDGWHSSCTALAAAGSCTVVSVDYRLAPAHQHPAALEDVLAVLDWVSGPAGVGPPGAGPPRVGPPGVGGDSAGGTLAACAALVRRDQGRPLSVQVLAYPPTDPACAAPSYRQGAFPDPRMLRTAWQQYRGVAAGERTTPYSTPNEAESLRGSAPAVVAYGDQDPVADDVRRLVERFIGDGVPVDAHELPGAGHGQLLLGAQLPDLLGTAARPYLSAEEAPDDHTRDDPPGIPGAGSAEALHRPP